MKTQKSERFIRAIGHSVVEIYKYHGLNEAIRIVYNAIKDLLPIHTIECAAKPSHSLWLINLASFSYGNSLKPQITTFDSLLANKHSKQMLDEKENTTVLLSRARDPQFFKVLTNGLDHAMCNCLLKTERNMVYLYIYAAKNQFFTPEDASFISRLLAPLSEELRHSFLLPSPFATLPDGQRMTSSVSLLQICPDLKDVEEQVRQIAPTDSLVLITGESGAGKDLVAKAVHELSPRRDKPFVKVNCGAIPDSLLDSELFGYERGAFTGAAHTGMGYFEQAEGGAIFLDEIGELSLAAQVRLLHVLENGQIQRVGASEPQKVNTRIIAATNKDLWAEAEAGAFREDLCYRLFVCHVEVPPLRRRRDDIPLLIWYFLNTKAAKMNMPPKLQLPKEEIQKMCAYPWPGNVRELEHTIERSLIYSGSDPRLSISIQPRARSKIVESMDAEWPDFDVYVADYLRRALAHTGGRVKGPRGAARLLNLNPGTLRSKCLKYQILGNAFPKK